MDESRYQVLADLVYRRIGDAFENVDPDVVDCEVAGDVLTLSFKGGTRCVLNTQRPTRQLWFAAKAQAWHFSYDEASRTWRDDKGRDVELFGQIARVVKELAGVDLAFAPSATALDD